MLRRVDDEEVEDMITIVMLSGIGRVIKSNLCTMLRELLDQRKKMKDV